MLLKALEKQIPSAKLLLEGADSSDGYSVQRAVDVWNEAALDESRLICVYGLSAALYGLARPWLDEERGRRLVFVEDEGSALFHLLQDDDAILLLNDLRVKIYFLETALQIALTAKKIAWAAVFQKMSFLLIKECDWATEFREELKKSHVAADLLLSDVSDWGCSAMKNARSNLRSCRLGKGLEGKFKNVPAVIVGAGPSLEKNGHLLSSLENKALIFAGGSALNALEAEPHFAASIDKEAPYRQFKTHPFSQTPFFFQSRMNKENFSLVHGEALLLPDGNFPAINWIQGEEELFDGGWTVANFLTAAACMMGCNPIIFVGMDLCYKKGQKYARLDASVPEGLIECLDRDGKAVWTQKDWLMAARWTEQFALRNQDRVFINATEGGLGFQAPILSHSLESVIEKYMFHQTDLRGQAHAAIQCLPCAPSNRWKEWDASSQRCEKFCEDLSNIQWEQLESEIVYRKLLQPLWEIWRSVFERELELDSQTMALQQKLKLNQILFFQQVLQEQIHGY